MRDSTFINRGKKLKVIFVVGEKLALEGTDDGTKKVKSSKWGGRGHFPSKKLYCRFWNPLRKKNPLSSIFRPPFGELSKKWILTVSVDPPCKIGFFAIFLCVLTPDNEHMCSERDFTPGKRNFLDDHSQVAGLRMIICKHEKGMKNAFLRPFTMR